MRRWSMALIAAAACSPAPALAGPCVEALTPLRDHYLQATLATMSTDGVVSYAQVALTYTPRAPGRRGLALPPFWATDSRDVANQLFSDRHEAGRPFPPSQADRIALSITHERSPAITIRLLSRENDRLAYSGTCSAEGIIHGTSPFGDVLINVAQVRIAG